MGNRVGTELMECFDGIRGDHIIFDLITPHLFIFLKRPSFLSLNVPSFTRTRLSSHCAFTHLTLYIPEGGIPYNGLYGEAPPEKGILSGFRYMKG